MNRKECEEALDWLYSLAVPCKEEVYDHRSSFLGEKYNLIKNLINEHFDNPPLKFEELKEGMWVWDNKRKAKLLIGYCYSKDDMAYYNFSNPEDYKYIHLEFEENRFYRKQVE